MRERRQEIGRDKVLPLLGLALLLGAPARAHADGGALPTGTWNNATVRVESQTEPEPKLRITFADKVVISGRYAITTAVRGSFLFQLEVDKIVRKPRATLETVQELGGEWKRGAKQVLRVQFQCPGGSEKIQLCLGPEAPGGGDRCQWLDGERTCRSFGP